MKPALAIMALFAAAFALPWLSLQGVRRAWQRDRRAASASGFSGAVFAALILRKAQVRDAGVVEGGRLFYERFNAAAGDVVLSRAVHDGRTVGALAHAALCAGCALQHLARNKSWLRLVYWTQTQRLLANVLPVLGALLLLHPARWRYIPVLVLFMFLIAGIQVLTFPAVRAAAARAREVILGHHLLPPAELPAFDRALKAAAERHLAAPLLDCFWLRWLF